MRKAQTEILGVALIVMILVIAGFFFLIRAAQPRESNLPGYVNPEKAQNFLNAIMHSKTDVNLKVSDIIKDCYNDRHDFCQGNCCEYARATIENALEETFSKDAYYELTVGDSDKIEPIYNRRCTGDITQPGFYYIPPGIEINLVIC